MAPKKGAPPFERLKTRTPPSRFLLERESPPGASLTQAHTHTHTQTHTPMRGLAPGPRAAPARRAGAPTARVRWKGGREGVAPAAAVSLATCICVSRVESGKEAHGEREGGPRAPQKAPRARTKKKKTASQSVSIDAAVRGSLHRDDVFFDFFSPTSAPRPPARPKLGLSVKALIAAPIDKKKCRQTIGLPLAVFIV